MELQEGVQWFFDLLRYIIYMYYVFVYVIIPQRSGRLKRNSVGFCNLNLIVV